MNLKLDGKRKCFVKCFIAAAWSQFAHIDKSKVWWKNHHFFLKDVDRKGATCCFSGALKVNRQCRWDRNEHWINIHTYSIYLNDWKRRVYCFHGLGSLLKFEIITISNSHHDTNVKSHGQTFFKKELYNRWFLCSHLYKPYIDFYRKQNGWTYLHTKTTSLWVY